MPDEEGNDAIDEAPETSLHAHGSGIEEENERPRVENAKGNILDDSEDSADDVEKTGGATSGGPGGHAEGEEDPSNVEHNPNS